MWKNTVKIFHLVKIRHLATQVTGKKFSKWHFWDKVPPRLFPSSGLPVQLHSHRAGLSPTGFYCEAGKQFWQRLVMQGRPHRCEGWAEKEAFQQEIVLCLSSLSYKSLFHRVTGNGRIFLSLKLGFSGLWCYEQGQHLPQFAPGHSAVPQADGTRVGAGLCPLYSTNTPQSKFMQKTPFEQWWVCDCWCSPVKLFGKVTTLPFHRCDLREQNPDKNDTKFPINLSVQSPCVF